MSTVLDLDGQHEYARGVLLDYQRPVHCPRLGRVVGVVLYSLAAAIIMSIAALVFGSWGWATIFTSILVAWAKADEWARETYFLDTSSGSDPGPSTQRRKPKTPVAPVRRRDDHAL